MLPKKVVHARSGHTAIPLTRVVIVYSHVVWDVQDAVRLVKFWRW